MKTFLILAAAAATLQGLAISAQAHSGFDHVHIRPELTPIGPKHVKPEWVRRFDTSVLDWQPRPPLPGPLCLSCPPPGFDPRVTTPPGAVGW